jgi:hypothetical protein
MGELRNKEERTGFVCQFFKCISCRKSRPSELVKLIMLKELKLTSKSHICSASFSIENPNNFRTDPELFVS